MEFNIDEGVKEYLNTKDAVLLDVRRVDEYELGHIENSILVPVEEIEKVVDVIQDKNKPVFVYCRSGNRSGKATRAMQEMGYTNVKNIGGIMTYSGKIVK